MTWGKQGSTDRQVRGPTGPNRSAIFKLLSVLVRSEIWKIFLFLVRFGPHFFRIKSEIYQSVSLGEDEILFEII